ncbi:glycine cleavage system T protein (aminomethyltransferase) [Mycobacteroides abscessus subsp. abscessus]|nr:glycine cleavage system T protein (aminomethyltransferase) [Mycobacteroides abscessus subsp. abscessus]
MMGRVIVIGSGILGASAAFHLASKGESVVLVDRTEVGQATNAAAGIICPWISQRRNKAWYELVKHGARYYPELVDKLSSYGVNHTGYRKVGALSLHTNEEKLRQMADRTIKRREDAPEIGEVNILTYEETKEVFPLVAEGYGAVYVSGGARVDGRLMRDALVKAAVQLGTEYVSGNASLVCEDSRVSGVVVDGKLFEADQVLVTTGAWAREVLEPVGVKFQVSGQKAQIVHLELPGVDTSKWPVVMPPNNQYLVTFEDGRVVVGSTHEDHKEFDTRVTAGGLNEIIGKALEVFPGLEEATVVETRVGFRPFTPDFLPVIGPVPGLKGVFVANGLGASGLTSGPFLGAELAKLALGEETVLDLSRYAVEGAIGD